MTHLRRAAHRNSEAITLIKDALGAFSLLAMLYIGLFIPTL
ncbi:MAG: hypothetical protein AAF386_03125 [Pseudomonadota bacterium]